MHTTPKPLFLIIAILMLFSIACRTVMGDPNNSEQEWINVQEEATDIPQPAVGFPEETEDMIEAEETATDMPAAGTEEAISEPTESMEPTATLDTASAPSQETPAESSSGASSSEISNPPFPLPEGEISNYGFWGTDQMWFSTHMTTHELVSFYRETFTGMGMTEQDAITVVTDEAFSLIFEGGPDGKNIQVVGAQTEGGLIEVNVFYQLF